MQANNKDIGFEQFWMGPEEQKVAEGFEALYGVPSNYSIPPAVGTVKEKLDAMRETSRTKNDNISVESAMNNLFGRFSKGVQKGFSFEPGSEDFAARPIVEEPVRSPLQVISPTAPVNIVLVEPRSYEESVDIVNHLKQRKSVIVNMQQLDEDTSMRVLDFVSGATYAMDGTQERVGNGVFIFASMNCRVESESEGTRAYKDLFAKTFGV